MITRPATEADAPQMSALLGAIIRKWQSPRAYDEALVRDHYISAPGLIQCTVAEEGGDILGFQVLKRAWQGNPYGVAPGWGIIGSYVKLGAHGRGVGRALFAETLRQARAAGLEMIDATIGDDNAEGLAYYEAMGFRSYRTEPGCDCKCLDVAAARAG